MQTKDPSIRASLERAYEEIKEYYDELEGESSRAAAILAVASLEDELEALVRAQFPRELSDKAWKKIGGPGFTPLGSFKARADVAEAYGLFGPKTRKVLDLIARVRNKFAHSPDVRNFLHPDIIEQCKILSTNQIYFMKLGDKP